MAPVEWVITNVSSDSGSPPASSSGTKSAIDLFLGLRLSSTPTSPNWKEPSTRTTSAPGSDAAATAMFTAIVVRPTPPFGLKTATTRPGSRATAARGSATGVAAIRPFLSRSRAYTWRMDAVSSSELKGLTRNSRAPASMERRR